MVVPFTVKCKTIHHTTFNTISMSTNLGFSIIDPEQPELPPQDFYRRTPELFPGEEPTFAEELEASLRAIGASVSEVSGLED